MQPNSAAPRPMREAAEMLAVQALGFIAEEPRTLSRFLESSGLSAEQIRLASRQPGFLAGVLEYVLGDEPLLIAFAESAGINPAEVARATSALGGHWERDVP
ncbi:MAG: DUF3572 domain-containing protein [Xanthobacteraceae bacterium]